MLKHKYLMCISASVLILSILLFLSWIALSERKFNAYAPESYGPEGLKATNLLLERAGYHVSVVDKLPESRQNLLIVITTGFLPGNAPTGRQKQLLDWVRRGGTIVELNTGSPSIQASRHNLSRLSIKKGRAFYATHQSGSLPANLNYHPNQTQVAVTKDPEQGFYGAGHHFFIYRQSLGAGKLISWNDLDGLTNRFLKHYPDNAVIFAAIIREFSPSGRIDFYNLAFKIDHSQVVRSSRIVFNHYWIGGLLLFLAMALVIWKSAARFGRPRPIVLARGRSYDEFVYSLASLFEQAGMRKFVLDNLWRDLMRIMADLTHLPTDASPEELISAMNRLTGKEYGPLLELYAGFNDSTIRAEAGAGTHTKLSLKHFLMIASKLDDYRKEFQAWKKSNPFAAE